MTPDWPTVVRELGVEIRKLKRENRQMWKVFSPRCESAYHAGCWNHGNGGKCVMSNCPLLKRKEARKT